jgi:hypothetical protein
VAIPQVIPIARIPAYRTQFAGTWSRGQFLGNVLSQTDPVAWAAGDRINARRWYAYLHEFDDKGNHLESTVESPGHGEEARQAAMLLLEEWIAGIPHLAYSDIAIRPFQFQHDAITFGLIIEDGHGTDWVELYPDRLAGHADVFAHNAGDTSTSRLTSWSTDRAVAEGFAGKNGVILQTTFEEMQPSGVNIFESPDYFDESELLLEGRIGGLHVTQP